MYIKQTTAEHQFCIPETSRAPTIKEFPFPHEEAEADANNALKVVPARTEKETKRWGRT